METRILLKATLLGAIVTLSLLTYYQETSKEAILEDSNIPSNFLDVSIQVEDPKFKVVAFYTGINDLAHVSFVKEANVWFPQIAEKYSFNYETTNDWEKLNDDFLSQYQVVIFLDTRPEDPDQRDAFQRYMDNGGSFIGFHFSAFALDYSDYPQNWDWFHNEFLGSGEYSSNTWKPTSAILRNEDQNHWATKNLPTTFSSQPNEWYAWMNDLRSNPDIKVLLSVDPQSFPLGTGPKPWEIWYEGDYPVVWTNVNYRMIYANMGHNDMDYDGGTNEQLSWTFNNEIQNTLIIDSLLWLGGAAKSNSYEQTEDFSVRN